MYITAFLDKLTELNWPKSVNVKPELFWQLKAATDAPLQSIENAEGKSELSFMCEVTRVCLDGHVTRPDKSDLTEFTIPEPTHGPLVPPLAGEINGQVQVIGDPNVSTGKA